MVVKFVMKSVHYLPVKCKVVYDVFEEWGIIKWFKEQIAIECHGRLITYKAFVKMNFRFRPFLS